MVRVGASSVGRVLRAAGLKRLQDGEEEMGLWIKLSVDYAEDPKVVAAGVEAELLFIRCLAWCKKHADDGVIPNHMIGRIGVGLSNPGEAAISLCETRLWRDMGDGYRIVAWASWNASDDDRSKGGKLGQHRRWHQTRPNPDCEFCDNSDNSVITRVINSAVTGVITEQSRTEQNRTLFVSQDASRLCDLLAELIHANGAKQPKVTQTWIDDMDRILRIDKIAAEEVEAVIRWCQADDFWHANILSPGKLRKQMAQLQLKRKRTVTNPATDAADTEWALVCHEIRKVGSYGTPHFENQKTLSAVRTIGWRNLCQMNEHAGKTAFTQVFRAG